MRFLLFIFALSIGTFLGEQASAQAALTVSRTDAPLSVGVRPHFTYAVAHASAASHTVALEIPANASVSDFFVDVRANATGAGKDVTATISSGTVTLQGLADGDDIRIFAPLQY